MKKLAVLLLWGLMLTGCGQKSETQVEFFTHNGCPYCEKALQYISANYPQLPMQVFEIGNDDNMKKFVACARRFKLTGTQLGTPLICMGQHYLLGWSPENEKLFNEYAKPFMK